MVEYTGTGAHFAGAAPGSVDLTRLRALYAPLGVEWLVPLGFDNTYAVVVRPHPGARRIDDLSADGPLRVATPREYLRRPRDGLHALATRHGLELAEPVVIESPGERYAALIEQRVDAAIGYATDGALADLDVRVLEDARSFFPPYEAVVVANASALEARPAIRGAVAPLEGRLDTPRMRALNAAVQMEGHDPGVVARRFLLSQKLLDVAVVTDPRAPLRMDFHVDDDLDPFVRVARDAVRHAWPDRPVRVERQAHPVRRVRRGDARLAVLGAERFFRSRRLRRKPRDERLEAVAVLGTRAVHVVRRTGDAGGPLDGRVGAPPSRSGAGRIADAILAQTAPARRGRPADLVQGIRDGLLDAAVIVAKVGDPRIAKAFADPGLELRPLAGWLDAGRASRHPYLRPARIRADAYPNQPRPVETIEAQVLLAGPRATGPGGGGPAAALPSTSTPLSAAEVTALSEASGVPEAPDPALPNAWQRIAGGPTKVDKASPTLDALLNVLALLFTFWLFRAVTARPAR